MKVPMKRRRRYRPLTGVLKKIIIAASVVAAVVITVTAQCAEKTPMVVQLWKDAIRLGGYTEQCNLTPRFCKEIPHVRISNIRSLGLYDYNDPKFVAVSWSLEPGSLDWQATVVHEFVHALDLRFGKIPFSVLETCEDNARAEERAYTVDAMWYAEHGMKVDYSLALKAMWADCALPVFPPAR